MATLKIKRTVELVITEDGDDRVLKRLDLKMVLAFTPESPETGRFGLPENYDPGEPALVEVDSATCEFFASDGEFFGVGGVISPKVADTIAREYVRLNLDALIVDLHEEIEEDFEP